MYSLLLADCHRRLRDKELSRRLELWLQSMVQSSQSDIIQLLNEHLNKLILTCAMSAMTPACRMYVDLPPIFGPARKKSGFLSGVRDATVWTH